MRRQMRARRPGRGKLRAEREHVQHGGGRGLLDQQPQQLEGRGIGPVQVFPHGQHRLPGGFLQQPGHQRILGLLPLLLWGHAAGRIAFCGKWHGQQGAKQGHNLFTGQTTGLEPLLQLGQFRFGGIGPLKLQHLLEVLNDGIEGTVGVIGRAP